MTAKSVCLRIKVAQLKYFGWKLPEYCNTWKCFTYSFEAEKQGDFFYITKKNSLKKQHCRGGLKVTSAETGNYFFVGLVLVKLMNNLCFLTRGPSW